MKLFAVIIGFLLSSTLAFAISDSTTVSTGAGVSGLSVNLNRAFQMKDGNLVEHPNSISHLSFRDVLFGGSSMFLTVNGKKYQFKLSGNSVSIQNGYANVAGATGAGQTGQGIGVSVSQNYQAYSPIKSRREKTNTCYGERVEVCRDYSHNGYGYECLSDTTSGSETLLIEYSEQSLPAVMTLSKGGTKLASVRYLTKAFSQRTIDTIYYCDADDFGNAQNIRRELRRRLNSMYGRKKEGKKKGQKIKKH